MNEITGNHAAVNDLELYCGAHEEVEPLNLP